MDRQGGGKSSVVRKPSHLKRADLLQTRLRDKRRRAFSLALAGRRQRPADAVKGRYLIAGARMPFTVSRSTRTGSIDFQRPTLEGALALATELIAANVPRTVVAILDEKTGRVYDEPEIAMLQSQQDGRAS